jgi:hypothetical protein
MNNSFKRIFLRNNEPSELNLIASTRLRYLLGFVLGSLGVLLAASSGSWDLTNHLLNKPETFFSPPHAGLYSGVGIVVFSSIWAFHYSRSRNMVHDTNTNVGYNDSSKRTVPLPTKLLILGAIMLLAAGPFDFIWHSTFGLDGLLSPSHLTLTMGMVVSGIGCLMGILVVNNSNLRSYSGIKMRLGNNERYRLTVLLIIGIVPVWLTLAGLTYMLSLPFSNTSFFKFNPDPNLAALIATLVFPFLTSFILTYSHLLTRKFGVLTMIGSAFVFINIVTSIIPNDHIALTTVFYLLNIIPFLAVDLLLSRFSNTSRNTIVYALSGAVLGLTFFMLYYPLIANIFNEVLPNEKPLWPSLTASTYFLMIGKIYPLVVLPALLTGILGALFASGLIQKTNQYVGLMTKRFYD